MCSHVRSGHDSDRTATSKRLRRFSHSSGEASPDSTRLSRVTISHLAVTPEAR